MYLSMTLTPPGPYPTPDQLSEEGFKVIPVQWMYFNSVRYDRDEVIGSATSVIVSDHIAGGVHCWQKDTDLMKDNYNAGHQWTRFFRSMVRSRYCAGWIAALLIDNEGEDNAKKRDIFKRFSPHCLDLVQVVTYYKRDVFNRPEFHYFQRAENLKFLSGNVSGFDLVYIPGVHNFWLDDNELPDSDCSIRAITGKCLSSYMRQFINERQATMANEARSRLVIVSQRNPEHNDSKIIATTVATSAAQQRAGGRSSGEFAHDPTDPTQDIVKTISHTTTDSQYIDTPKDRNQIYLEANRTFVKHVQPEAPTTEDNDRRHHEMRTYMAFGIMPAIIQSYGAYLDPSNAKSERPSDVAFSKTNSAMSLFIQKQKTDRIAYEQLCSSMVNGLITTLDELEEGNLQFSYPGAPDIATITALLNSAVLSWQGALTYFSDITRIPIDLFNKTEPNYIKILKEGEPEQPAKKKAKTS